MDGWIHGVGEAGVDGDVVSPGRRVPALLAQLLLPTPFSSSVGEPNLEIINVLNVNKIFQEDFTNVKLVKFVQFCCLEVAVAI